MKLRNVYREGLDDSIFASARLNSNWGCLKVVTEEDLQVKNGGIILTGQQAESKMGVLFFTLINAGDAFTAEWDARVGDVFLLSHLAGDKLGKYVFVESQDILMKYGDNIFKEE